MKISVLGCGLRTPLLLSGLLKTGRLPSEVVLYDLEPEQATLMMELGRATVPDSPTRVKTAVTPEEAIDSTDYVISSIRPGGMAARARDERAALEAGYAGQETVGPAGVAMAWRTVPAMLEYARIIERCAPHAWMVNFTNPAGLVTQAIHEHSGVKAVGICDTPAELFFRIALSFGVGPKDVHCDYFGLNHLGFVRRVEVAGEDRTAELLADQDRLRSLYPTELFPPELIRQIGLIPTEYVFFYYRPSLARANQLKVGRTRAEELMAMNRDLYGVLAATTKDLGAAAGLQVYARYLNHRNASYLQLEGGGKSAFTDDAPDWDPFAAETGYHRIAVDTIQALSGHAPADIVLNVANQGALTPLLPNDVVEILCRVSADGIERMTPSAIPQSVCGLLESTKVFERALVRASVERRPEQLQLALMHHPLVRDWDEAGRLAGQLSLSV